MEQALEKILMEQCGKGIDEATNEELYAALLCITKEKMADLPKIEGPKKL